MTQLAHKEIMWISGVDLVIEIFLKIGILKHYFLFVISY